MATTLSVTSKTTSSIVLSATKTATNSMTVTLGRGTTFADIYANPIASEVKAGGAGTYSYTFSSGLSPNTQYGAVAWLYGGGESEISNVVDATLPSPAPTISLSRKDSTSATFSYSTSPDGGYYQKIIQYSLDGGATWSTGATVSGGAAASGVFTVSSLSPRTSYTLRVRSATSAGSTSGASITFETEEAPSSKKVYGSANGLAEQLTGFYGSSNSQAQIITKLYGGVEVDPYYTATTFAPVVGFDLGTFLAKAESRLPAGYVLDNAEISSTTSTFTYRVTYTIDSTQTSYGEVGTWANISRIGEWGITFDPSVVGTQIPRTEIVDFTLVSGQVSQLCYQGFGHLTYT